MFAATTQRYPQLCAGRYSKRSSSVVTAVLCTDGGCMHTAALSTPIILCGLMGAGGGGSCRKYTRLYSWSPGIWTRPLWTSPLLSCLALQSCRLASVAPLVLSQEREESTRGRQTRALLLSLYVSPTFPTCSVANLCFFAAQGAQFSCFLR